MNWVFVTGAPRSGTTYVGDWLTEMANGYCVHEVRGSLEGLSAAEVAAALMRYANSGSDRLDKPAQRAFMKWGHLGGKNAANLLGLKEPNTWRNGGQPGAIPPTSIWDWLNEYRVHTIILVRHPADVIASGKRRGLTTSNWPAYDSVTMCEFWLNSARLYRTLAKANLPVLALRWETVMLTADHCRDAIESFLGVDLPPFEGNERSVNYLERVRRLVDPCRGVVDGPDRSLLDSGDRDCVAETLIHPDSWKGYLS